MAAQSISNDGCQLMLDMKFLRAASVGIHVVNKHWPCWILATAENQKEIKIIEILFGLQACRVLSIAPAFCAEKSLTFCQWQIGPTAVDEINDSAT
jgi:hypothetical protein